jgi:hypothetical protein
VATTTTITCPPNKWTRVVLNTKQGRIRDTLTNPINYYFDVKPTGSLAPSDALITGSPFPFHGLEFQYREPVDIYIYPFDEAGRIEYFTDSPYMDVFVQDQHTPLIQFPMQVQNLTVTTLTAATVIDARLIQVTDASIFTAGDLITLISEEGRFYQGRVLSKAVNDITVDTPLDYAFQTATTEAISGTDEMSVDGSGTPVTFKVRGKAGSINVPVTLDITRLIGTMLTATAPALDEFGDLTALTNGMVLRSTNGIISNIHNVKTNLEISARCYDYDVIVATNPGVGVWGIKWRMTFAGQSKHGVTVRLEADESLDYIIQDDISGLTSLKIIAEGHIVD